MSPTPLATPCRRHRFRPATSSALARKTRDPALRPGPCGKGRGGAYAALHEVWVRAVAALKVFYAVAARMDSLRRGERAKRGVTFLALSSLSSLLRSSFDVERDLDLFADEDAAGLEGGVPVEAVVLAVEGRRRGEADDLRAEGRGATASLLGVDRDLAGDAVHRQVAGDF